MIKNIHTHQCQECLGPLYRIQQFANGSSRPAADSVQLFFLACGTCEPKYSIARAHAGRN